jgi:polynucleotide 5'-hydroxyl-kinase GRC3/NOL9
MRNQQESADTKGITVPEEWHRLPLEEFSGVVMVIGANDSGKSTLVRWLVDAFKGRGRSTARLDGDIGQAELGLPGTMTLALPVTGSTTRDRVGFFVGNTSPRGHMLPMLVGLRRLLDRSGRAGVEVTVMDTTGMVRGQAGIMLKEWKCQMVRPANLIALQREDELEPILQPLQREDYVRVHLLPVSPYVRIRTVVEREAHRRRKYLEGLQDRLRSASRSRGCPCTERMRPNAAHSWACLTPRGFARPWVCSLIDQRLTGSSDRLGFPWIGFRGSG